jgi:signal transduction histidine kinase
VSLVSGTIRPGYSVAMREVVVVPRRGGSVRLRTAVFAAQVAMAAGAAAATPALFRQLAQTCPRASCGAFERLTPAAAAVLAAAGLGTTAWAGLIVVLAWLSLLVGLAVAGLLLRRLAMQPLAVVTAAGAVLVGLTPFSVTLRPWFLAATGALVPCFAALFPTGTWVPAVTRRWWPLLAVLLAGLRLGDALLGSRFASNGWRGLVGVVAVVLLAGCQVYRYVWVSDAVARSQARGVLLGMLALAATVAASAAAEATAEGSAPSAPVQLTIVVADYAATAFVMVMLAVALLRYRLYDVDLMVRRSVLYVGALGALAAVYLVVVATASVAMSQTTASALAAAAVAVVAVLGGMLAVRLLRALRTRLYGFGSTHGAAAAAIARSLKGTGQGAEGLAATIAAALAVSYVAVRDGEGRLVSEHLPCPETRDPEAHRLLDVPVPVRVAGSTGPEILGRVVLALPWGQPRLSRRDEAVLDEALPFVALVLRSQHEARLLREAQSAAAASREDERRRLRRDLHDGVGPLLAAQLLAIDTLRLEPERQARDELLTRLESATHEALVETRRIARDLRPDALDGTGLEAAVRAEAARFTAAGLPVTVDWSVDGECLPDAVEVAAFRVVQESLSNAARHAAAARCEIALRDGEAAVELSVTDDGCGRGERPDGLGTASMRERVTELGGRLTVTPGPGGLGTSVRAVLPR